MMEILKGKLRMINRYELRNNSLKCGTKNTGRKLEYCCNEVGTKASACFSLVVVI